MTKQVSDEQLIVVGNYVDALDISFDMMGRANVKMDIRFARCILYCIRTLVYAVSARTEQLTDQQKKILDAAREYMHNASFSLCTGDNLKASVAFGVIGLLRGHAIKINQVYRALVMGQPEGSLPEPMSIPKEKRSCFM